MHARGSGPRVMITRQPTEGRSRNGGLKFELSVLNSHTQECCFLIFKLTRTSGGRNGTWLLNCLWSQHVNIRTLNDFKWSLWGSGKPHVGTPPHISLYSLYCGKLVSLTLLKGSLNGVIAHELACKRGFNSWLWLRSELLRCCIH